MQHVFEHDENAAHVTAVPLPAASTPAHVRPGAAFAKLTSASVVPDDFAMETFDALVRYSEAVASGHLSSKLLPAPLERQVAGASSSADGGSARVSPAWHSSAASNKHPRPGLVGNFLGDHDI